MPNHFQIDGDYHREYCAGFEQGAKDAVERRGAYMYGENVNKSDAWRDGYGDAYAEYRAAQSKVA